MGCGASAKPTRVEPDVTSDKAAPELAPAVQSSDDSEPDQEARYENGGGTDNNVSNAQEQPLPLPRASMSVSFPSTPAGNQPPGDMRTALRKLLQEYPYLSARAHPLFHWIQKCQEAIDAGDEALACDHLERIEQQVEQEEQTLAAAFNRFDLVRSGYLDKAEVKFMCEYLGFPSSDADVDTVIKAVDREGDGQMSLAEFQLYVARMGGSEKLFEVRRRQMMAKSGCASQGAEMDRQELRVALLDAGIQEDAQAAWRLVVPPYELEEAAKLVDCQRSAVRHIRMLAKSNHEAALSRLQMRVQQLGYSDNDLWMTLAWIRDLAPIILHLNLDKMMQFMENDTHYRNQFETASSGGLLKPAVREKWERDLFGGTYDGATGFDRCKYGVLNVMNDHRGVVKCSQYGDSYVTLKGARLRCTFSPEDSANLKADRLAVLDYYAHVLCEYNNEELKETMKVANSGAIAVLGDSDLVRGMKYKETQIHGEVCFAKHVERLVAHTRHKKDEARLAKICERHGWNFSWMDEERNRMAAEERQQVGARDWKARLRSLVETGVPDAVGVPEGFCRTGCGRPVAPGLTACGKPYRTCCRGCVMGFGHDLHCGNIDSNMLGQGMCGRGCGRTVAPGKRASGRPFTTCCRGCAMGTGHSPSCGNPGSTTGSRALLSSSSGGLCKKGCGRKAAVGAQGRRFDTCCRSCAKGRGTHDEGCTALEEAVE